MSENPQEDAEAAVKRLQQLDPQSVVRSKQLGPFSFEGAVGPLRKLVRIFEQIPVNYIKELPDQQASQLLNQANAILNRVRELDDFDPKTEDSPAAKQKALIDSLEQAYPATFTALWHHIGYLASRERDFAAMEVEGRAAIEAIKSEANELKTTLDSQQGEAERILSDIKQVAAETGVSQQAFHFATESSDHKNEAEIWEARTKWALAIVVAYGFIAIFLHKIPLLSPENAYDTVQLAVSKVVIFLALFYALTLCAKNYLAHKHSQAVNKHRQNALLTYKTIADAAHDEAGRDIVLSHAADCIFSPQDTGYLSQKAGVSSSDTPPTLQVLPRIASGTEN